MATVASRYGLTVASASGRPTPGANIVPKSIGEHPGSVSTGRGLGRGVILDLVGLPRQALEVAQLPVGRDADDGGGKVAVDEQGAVALELLELRGSRLRPPGEVVLVLLELIAERAADVAAGGVVGHRSHEELGGG